MPALHNLQQEFLGYLMDNADGRISDRIVSTPEHPARQRLGFYAHAYRARLKEALETDYETLHIYLGDELFGQLVDEYIAANPSRHPSLRDFGRSLPMFTANTEPFNQWPEVAEIAVIEQAFADSFDAADAEAINLSELAEIEPEGWVGLRLHFQKSVQIIRQRYNSFQIWQALSSEQQPPQKIADQAAWLVWRQNLVSRYRSLDQAELAALELALRGECFADICTSLSDHFNERETAQQALAFLQQWLHDGMVVNLEKGNKVKK